MGGFIKCLKTEYNLDNKGIVDYDEDDDEEEDEEEKNEKPSALREVGGRLKSVSNIYPNEINSNTIHYCENHLDTDGEISRRKSNTVFVKSNLQNNL